MQSDGRDISKRGVTDIRKRDDLCLVGQCDLGRVNDILGAAGVTYGEQDVILLQKCGTDDLKMTVGICRCVHAQAHELVLNIGRDGVGSAETADAYLIRVQKELGGLVEKISVLDTVCEVQCVQNALKDLLHDRCGGIVGGNLLVYDLYRRNDILSERDLELLIGAVADLLTRADNGSVADAALCRQFGNRQIYDLIRMLDDVIANELLRFAQIAAHSLNFEDHGRSLIIEFHNLTSKHEKYTLLNIIPRMTKKLKHIYL